MIKTMYNEIGYCLIRKLINPDLIKVIKSEYDDPIRCGNRNLDYSENVINAGAIILNIISEIVNGNSCYKLAWITLFDKNSDSNWRVPMHIDEMAPILNESLAKINNVTEICIKENHLYGKLLRSQLKSTISARLSIDDSNTDKGPLLVIPGSHCSESQMDSKNAIEVLAKSGDVIVMSPLLLHSSEKLISDVRRRVLHFNYVEIEYCGFIGNQKITAQQADAPDRISPVIIATTPSRKITVESVL